jgi:hypothetical protein
MVVMNKMQKLTDQVPVAVAAQETVVCYEKPARARRRGEFLLHQLEHGAVRLCSNPRTLERQTTSRNVRLGESSYHVRFIPLSHCPRAGGAR